MVECQALRCREPAVGRQPIFLALAFWPVRRAQTTIGLFIAVLAVAALAAFAVWEEWLSLIAGLWLVGSPWVLGFEDSDKVRIYLVTGTIVAALAAFKVWLVHQGDRRITLGN